MPPHCDPLDGPVVESRDTHDAERDDGTACGCGAPCEAADRTDARRVLPVVWRRLVTDGETCPRCGSTEIEVERAVSTLAKVLAPLGIAPTLETQALDRAEFEAAPSESNRIFIAGQPLESWLGATVSASQCCSVCGDDRCRTVEVDGTTFETIPERLIVKAGLLAAAALVDA
jgi:hypothetical protein